VDPGAAFDPHTAFSGPVVRGRAPLPYRVAVVLVTIVVVLLPAIYLAIIALDLWFVYDWATGGAVHTFGEGRGSRVSFYLYVAPIVIGLIIAFFMVKPFFAPRVKQASPLALDPSVERRLYDYVERMCDAMHAPRPVRIDVDTRLNASASFDGGLHGLATGRLVLTIGLPLAATLTLRQLTAVMAHEFGHFGQGAAMRFYWLSTMVNLWFARVVHERDEWDERLRQWTRFDYRIAIVVWLARGLVWCSRRVLWLLMQLSHLLTMALSRQMEFNADTCAASVAGVSGFTEGMRLLPVLELAERGAHHDIDLAWEGRRLPDDMPSLVAVNVPQVQEETRRAVIEQAMTGTVGMYDSHPPIGERIRRVEAGGQSGVLVPDGPASILFSDFPDLCRRATRLTYEDVFGEEFQPGQLVETAGVAETGMAVAELRVCGREALGKGEWRLTEVPTAVVPEPGDERAALRVPAESSDGEAASRLYEDRVALWRAEALVSAGCDPGLQAQGVADGRVEGLRRRLEERERDAAPALTDRGRQLEALGRRFGAALELAARDPSLVSEEELALARSCARSLGALSGVTSNVASVNAACHATSALLEQVKGEAGERLAGTIMSQVRELRRRLIGLQEGLGQEGDPFPPGGNPRTLAAAILPGIPPEGEPGLLFNAAVGSLHAFSERVLRCVGTLERLARKLEERT